MGSCPEVWDRMLGERVDGVRDWAIACLKVARMGCKRGEGRKQHLLRERVNGVKDWATNWFKKSKTGCDEGEGRKRITLRVIELCSAFGPPAPPTDPLPRAYLSSVNVEEYEVLGFGQGGNGP